MDVSTRQAAKAHDVRFVLRTETRLEHESLDGHPAFSAMTGGTLSLDQYRGVMLALHRAYRTLDPLLVEACAKAQIFARDFTYAPRLPILSTDLASLEAADADLDGPLPQPLIPEIDSPAALAGILYVVEGSVLGGAMLHRSTLAILGSGRGGNGYWSWCAAEGAARWAMTCRMLSRLDTGPAARAAMIAHARCAFRLIDQAFRPLARSMRERAEC